MKIVNKEEFESIINQGSVVVDFFADWCGPCKMLSPVLEELSAAYPEITFIKVNVDQEPELASRYGVMSIPALFAVKNGQIKKSAVGFQPKPMLEEFIKNAQ